MKERGSLTLLCLLLCSSQRVRRSPFCTNPRFDVAVETLCTMRHWEKKGGNHHSMHHHHSTHLLHKEGPELVLQTVQDVLLESRDVTPGKCRRKSLNGNPSLHNNHHHATNNKDNQAKSASTSTLSASIAIPLAEIVIVEKWPRRSYKLTVTTIHQGLLEFDLKNSNRHDMLLAFLQAHLPAERIQQHATTTADGISVHSTCSSQSQMDVDYLQERTIREQAAAAAETWPERLTRRMSNVVHSIQAMSGTICDLTVCCRDGTTTTNATTNAAAVSTSPTTMSLDVRDAAEPVDTAPAIQQVNSWNMPVANGGHLEMDEEISTSVAKQTRRRKQRSRRQDSPARLV